MPIPAEVEEGGETTLPLATAIDEDAQSLADASVCAKKMGIAIKPKKGVLHAQISRQTQPRVQHKVSLEEYNLLRSPVSRSAACPSRGSLGADVCAWTQLHAGPALLLFDMDTIPRRVCTPVL